MGWPDLLIGIVAVMALLRGWTRGFVGELSGAVALAAALITPWFYNGSMDGWISGITRLGPGSAHVVGMFLTGIITYAIVMAIAWVLDRIAHLPLLGVGNAVGGAIVGLIKAAVFCWLVLYVALFFPLSPDIRASLHSSATVQALTKIDPTVDAAMKKTLPWFARPFINPYFWRHTP